MIVKYLSFISIFILCISCTSIKKVSYLDSDFPNLTPKRYAKQIFSLNNRYEHGISMRKFGKEHYSILTAKDWLYKGILRYTKHKNGTIKIDTIKFKETNSEDSGIIAGEAMFSKDEKTMYFVSNYPTDIWKSEINKNNEWTSPKKLHSLITNNGSEWYPFIGNDNCLYYQKDIDGNTSIYKSCKMDNQFVNGIKLEASFNYDCGEPFFSKKMDYIVYSAKRDSGYGNLDLYVAFKNKDGTWSEEHNLGDNLNTSGYELAPYISNDGKYLFFTRRDKFEGASFSDIYWVSTDLIKNIRKN